jgi:hypothetical protein
MDWVTAAIPAIFSWKWTGLIDFSTCMIDRQREPLATTPTLSTKQFFNSLIMAMLILLPKTKLLKMGVRFVKKLDSNAIMKEF